MVLLNKSYMNNPYMASPSMTPEEFRQSMIDSYNPNKPKDPNTMFLSPKFEPSKQIVQTQFGPREVEGAKITSLFQSGEELNAEMKAAQDKEKVFLEGGGKVEDTLPKNEEDIIPQKEPNESKKSFMDKLVSGVNKVFTLQDTNPEAYNRIMSGLDLYKRGQEGDDIATALLGNSKFKKEQAQALFDASLKALDFEQSTIKVAEAKRKLGTVDEPSADLQKMAKSILDTQYDIEDEGVAFAISSRAKEFQAANPGIGSGTALNFVIEQAVASGELTSGKGNIFKKGKFESKIGKPIEIGDNEQDKLDALPKGTQFTYKGKTYIK
jgi:hypothetical protein